MALIQVLGTNDRLYTIEGDSFHTQKDIGQVIISQKNEGKVRTVASFNCDQIIGVVYADNTK
jgi:hypothetical protein